MGTDGSTSISGLSTSSSSAPATSISSSTTTTSSGIFQGTSNPISASVPRVATEDKLLSFLPQKYRVPLVLGGIVVAVIICAASYCCFCSGGSNKARPLTHW